MESFEIDELDDIIGILNSSKNVSEKVKDIKNGLESAATKTVTTQPSEEEKAEKEKVLSNIEKMMTELEELKRKKSELVERNNRLKEN